MAIKIPTHFMGRDGKEELKRIMEGKDEVVKVQDKIIVPSTNIKNPENYIILDGRKHGSYEYSDMLVSKNKTHFDKDWTEQHKLLYQEQAQMLSIRQFADFLSLLKSGKAFDGRGNKVDSKELKSILEDIIVVKDPYRAEYLDADFKVINKVLYINYEHTLKNGIFTPKYSEPLADCLTKDKLPGIDLNDWLANANYQGLPVKKVKSGELYYWSPVEGRVAGFDANSGRAFLYCDRDPSVTYSSLGVRPSRAKI